jgi:hypothetical protein
MSKPELPIPPFDGETYEHDVDYHRLKGQLQRVFALMMDRQWRTLQEVHASVGGSETGCSARLRDLRKERFGGHTVLIRRVGSRSEGRFEYQLHRASCSCIVCLPRVAPYGQLPLFAVGGKKTVVGNGVVDK